MSSVRNQIIDLRKRCGLTQAELAERLGTCQPAVSRFEKPGYSDWSVRTLVRLAEAMNARLIIRLEPLDASEPRSEEVTTERARDWIRL